MQGKVLMGRKNEFKATKSFTITMSELSWLAEYSDRTNQKASAVVNRLIREAMLKDKTDPNRDTTPASCDTCDAWTPHNKHFVCLECKEVNTKLKELWWQAIQIPESQ